MHTPLRLSLRLLTNNIPVYALIARARKEKEYLLDGEREREIKRGRKAIRASKRKTKVQLKANEERSNVGKAEFSGRLTIAQMDRFLNSSLHRSTISMAKYKRKLRGRDL